MELDSDSLERLVPERMDPADLAGAATLELHLERYRFAAGQVRPGRLLDLACGVGYGTRLMADRNGHLESALGVDIAAAAVQYALTHYADERVRFLCCDGMSFEDADGFDTIVSLETIEHVPGPDALFARLVALLRPGGVLVSSVPVTPSVDLNPHHLRDFTSADFRRMGRENGLVERAEFEQVQRVNPLELMRGKRFGRSNLRPDLVRYYLARPSAALTRLRTTLRHGFAARYLTLAWQREA